MWLTEKYKGGVFFLAFSFCFFLSWLLLASWLLWLLRSWLLVAPGGSGGSCWLLGLLRLLWLPWLLWLLWLLAPMAHLSSIDQSISEACSPGACCALETHLSILYLYFYLYLYLLIYIYISTSTSISIPISTSISLSQSLISISIYTYIYIYLSKRFALSSRWCSNPKPTLNQTIIYSTPTLCKEILNQQDDNIQWNYCASLCLNLHSTCFQGACRVVYTPWVSHSTQHLACENRIK